MESIGTCRNIYREYAGIYRNIWGLYMCIHMEYSGSLQGLLGIYIYIEEF